MKRSFFLLVLAALIAPVIFPGQAQAQGFRVGPHLGINFDGTDINLGVDAQFGVPFGGERDIWGHLGLDIYPFQNVEGQGGEEFDLMETRININALLPFNAASVKVYGGGGLAIGLISIDAPDFPALDGSDTELAINLMAGVLLGEEGSGIRPFVELVQTAGGFSDLTLRGGAYFSFGRPAQ